MSCEFLPLHPPYFFEYPILNLAAPRGDPPKDQQDRFFPGIAEFVPHQFLAGVRIDAQLLAQFANERRFWRFARLQFAPRKLPFQRMRLVGPSAANENLAPVLKHSRNHFSHGYNWSTSPQLIEHFTNPRNVGELPAPAVIIEVSNPICGDILRLSAVVENGRIAQSRFKVRGCTASIAAGSALTELLAERDKAGLAKLTASDVEHAVGGLSNESKHAAVLCMDAVHALLTQFPV